VSSRTSRAIQRNPVSGEKKIFKKKKKKVPGPSNSVSKIHANLLGVMEEYLL
jgi:hypothetical protein